MKKTWCALLMWGMIISPALADPAFLVDPNIPAPNQPIDSYSLRNQFGNVLSDELLLYSLITSGGSPLCGSAGQICWNNGTVNAGLTMTGDCTIVPSTGIITCSTLGGVNPFDASNISSGTLHGARLPTPTSIVLGGVKSAAAIANQFVTGIDTTGAVTTSALPIATTGQVGVAKPDGTTITIDVDGTMHSVGGGGSGITALSGDVIAAGPGSAPATLQNNATARSHLGLGTTDSVTFGPVNAGAITATGLTLTTALGISSGGTSSNSSTNLLTTLSKNSALLLPHWRAALARVRAGTGNATVYFIGDSTMIGYTATGGMLSAPPAQLVNMFNAVGLNANYNNRIGSNVATDSRYSSGSWGLGGASIGGNNSLFATSATGSPASFAPQTAFDTVNLYWYTTGTSAQFSYNIDGGSPTTITTGTSTGIHTTTFTTSLATHTINVNWVSGIPGFIGFNAYDSSKKWVFVYNGGAGAFKSSDWAAPGNGVYQGLNTTTYLAQDLTVIDLGINDWCNGSVSVGTYTTNMQTIITRELTAGDVVLLSPIPSQPGVSGGGGTCPSNAVQQTFVDAMFSLAITNNIPIIDTFGRWVSYSASNSFGYWEGDGLHPTQPGMADQTSALYQALYNP